MLAFMSSGINVAKYSAYEIDKYAIAVTQHNFPEIEQNGDVFDADFTQYENIDFLIGGSPCTYWSIAQKNDRRETEASGLGWELFCQYVRALKEAKPKYFIYENNKSIAKAIYESISNTFGFEPILINSALVSAQNRNRYYWCGIRNDYGTYRKSDIPQPEDRGILLRDVLDGVVNRDKSRAIISSIGRTTTREYFKKNQGQMTFEPVGTTKDGKSYCLTSGYSNGSGENIGNYVAHTLSKGCKSMVAEPVNTTKDGKSQTIKAQYQQTSIANICKYTSTYGATGVAEPVETSPVRVGAMPRPNGELSTSQAFRVYSTEGKSVNLTAGGGGAGGKTGLYAIPVKYENGNPVKAISAADGKIYIVHTVKDGMIEIKGKNYPIKLADGFYIIRKLTVSECKRLQTVPEWYDFSVISDSQAYKCLGNGWTVEVIAHLMKNMFH
jgi:DNA (cytosine-5)-methyltransferase 3A